MSWRQAICPVAARPIDRHGAPTVMSVKQMTQFGVPCTHYLGVYLGLKALGFEPSPKLFGVNQLSALPGAGN